MPNTIYDPAEHFKSVCGKRKNGVAAGSEPEISTQLPLLVKRKTTLACFLHAADSFIQMSCYFGTFQGTCFHDKSGATNLIYFAAGLVQ